jgi:hypothetical protein
MKKLIRCRTCESDISSRASRCPQCGEPTQHRGNVIAVVVVILIVLGGAFGLIHAYDEAQESRFRMEQQERK